MQHKPLYSGTTNMQLLWLCACFVLC